LDSALNQQLNKKAELKAIIAQIKQLIDVNKISKGNGNDQAYNFEDNKNVKRIFVTETAHEGISQGKLAIVKVEGQYEVIPAPVADKIKERDESYIILRNNPAENSEEMDDFYSDYEVPDDLMW